MHLTSRRFAICIVVAFSIVTIWLCFGRRSEIVRGHAGTPEREAEKNSGDLSVRATQSNTLAVGLKEAYLTNKAIDRDYDWKVPIDFFGKVLDQDNDPVASAAVELSWTDLSQ